jgi:hypothetical protein
VHSNMGTPILHKGIQLSISMMKRTVWQTWYFYKTNTSCSNIAYWSLPAEVFTNEKKHGQPLLYTYHQKINAKSYNGRYRPQILSSVCIVLSRTIEELSLLIINPLTIVSSTGINTAKVCFNFNFARIACIFHIV